MGRSRASIPFVIYLQQEALWLRAAFFRRVAVLPPDTQPFVDWPMVEMK
jgi:hypothetical protein